MKSMKRFMTTSKTTLIAALAGLSLTACANGAANYTPILADCQSLAAQNSVFNDNTLASTLVGAGVGALVGLSSGYDVDAEDALVGAAIGGTVGGGAGVFQGRGDQKDIVIRCMAGRGYKVLG